ncbi:MAG: hypothetical protein [Wendovervirus sonii]|uniref:Uncharacterized protein n=1 Tax=phage Lak_Megaphage_Sonny TaxID=3109229 RepID=A0ABZ0Z6J6_9CAUD|nr:MAG: hypothetical protein [phage Lak_Megaphage_Sonny]
MLLFDYNNKTYELDYFPITDIDQAIDLIETMLICNKINENVKIKAPSLSCNGDLDNSKLYDDALNGTKEVREFEDKVEKDTQAAGVDNPLAPIQPQQESIEVNGNELHESKKENSNKMKETYKYNIGDWVIIKDNDMKAQVNNIIYDASGNITLFTIVASNGIAYDLDELDEIKPDPLYLDNIPGRVINSQNLTVPRFAEFDIDPDTRLTRIAQNEKLPDDYHRDLNKNTVYVYILKDGRRLCEEPYVANFEDIQKSKKIIRVLDENNNIEEYDANKDLEFLEMPYAAVVDSNDKPVRSIQIDPKSYINAGMDDMVVCKVDGKMTKFPKSRIKILS